MQLRHGQGQDAGIDEGASDSQSLAPTKGALDHGPNPRLVAVATPENVRLPDSNGEDLSPEVAINTQRQDRDIEYYASLEWTPDGTSLLATSHDHRTLCTYVLPPELLARPASSPYHRLKPCNAISLPEPCHASAVHPAFALSSPETCLYIASPRALPIRLVSPFATGVIASYPLINELTEEWTAPHSLLFHPRNPQTFYAGCRNRIAVFDLHRDGEQPSAILMVGGSKRRGKAAPSKESFSPWTVDAGANGLRSGIVSALAANTEGTIAAGTFTGDVGLFDLREHGGFVAKLGMPPNSGQGVTQTSFHPRPTMSNYLLVGSRQADTSQIFDLRATQQPLATLVGRKAGTMQRLSHCISEAGDVWGGGTDGVAQAWGVMGELEGEVQPKLKFKAFGDAIGGIGLHPGCAVLAACAGSRHFNNRQDMASPRTDNEEDTETGILCSEENEVAWDNNLKIWDMSTVI